MGNTVSYNRGIMGLRGYTNGGSSDPDDELYRQLMRRLFGGEAPPTIHSYGPDIDDAIWGLVTDSGATPPPNWVELPDTPEDFFKAEGNRLEYLKRKPDISDPFGGGRTQGLGGWTNPITEGFEPRPKYLPPGNYLPPGHIDLDSDILDQPIHDLDEAWRGRRDIPPQEKLWGQMYDRYMGRLEHMSPEDFDAMLKEADDVGRDIYSSWTPGPGEWVKSMSLEDLTREADVTGGHPNIFSPPDRGYGRGRIDDFIREAGGRPPHYLDQQPFRVYPPLPDEHFDNFAEMMGGTMTPEGEVKIPLGQTGDAIGVTTIDMEAAANRIEARLAAQEAAEKAAKKAAAKKAAIRGAVIAGASTLALPAELAAEFALFPEELGSGEVPWLNPPTEYDFDYLDHPLNKSTGSQRAMDELIRKIQAGTPVNRRRR